jgi:hypothetical protein
MYLKIMSLVPGMRYSTIPAPPSGKLAGVPLTVKRLPQIPRRSPGSRLRGGLSTATGCAWTYTCRSRQVRIRWWSTCPAAGS